MFYLRFRLRFHLRIHKLCTFSNVTRAPPYERTFNCMHMFSIIIIASRGNKIDGCLRVIYLDVVVYCVMCVHHGYDGTLNLLHHRRVSATKHTYTHICWECEKIRKRKFKLNISWYTQTHLSSESEHVQAFVYPWHMSTSLWVYDYEK